MVQITRTSPNSCQILNCITNVNTTAALPALLKDSQPSSYILTQEIIKQHWLFINSSNENDVVAINVCVHLCEKGMRRAYEGERDVERLAPTLLCDCGHTHYKTGLAQKRY